MPGLIPGIGAGYDIPLIELLKAVYKTGFNFGLNLN